MLDRTPERAPSSISARLRQVPLLLIASLLALSVGVSPLAIGSDQAVEQLVKRLQQGGLVIYWRHAQTDKSTSDHRPLKFDDCSEQRNLSVSGRQDAREVGLIMARLQIPVSEIHSSPYCRTLDTARLAFPDSTVQPHPGLAYVLGEKREVREENTRALNKLLLSPPVSGNRVVVSHTANLKEALDIWPENEGQMVILQPGNQPQAIGVIDIPDWFAIAADK